MNLEKITQQVIILVREVSAFIQAEAESFGQEKIEYKDVNNLVSYVDKEAERKLVAGLREILPEASFITEEDTTGQTPDLTVLNWIIDPLDGTANFVHGLPIYCVSVGLVDGKVPLAGVIHEPNRDEMFHAWQGGGAWCNGRRLQVTEARHLGESLLATGFPYYKFDKHDRYMKILEVLMQKTHGLRRLGAAAVDLAYVAAGRFEGFYEYNLKSWDMAAGVLLVLEAGGKVTDFTGGNDYLFGGDVVAGGPVHAELLATIREHFDFQ